MMFLTLGRLPGLLPHKSVEEQGIANTVSNAPIGLWEESHGGMDQRSPSSSTTTTRLVTMTSLSLFPSAVSSISTSTCISSP